jgi:hypothetical protein
MRRASRPVGRDQRGIDNDPRAAAHLCRGPRDLRDLAGRYSDHRTAGDGGAPASELIDRLIISIMG